MYSVTVGWAVNGLESGRPRVRVFDELELATAYYNRVNLAREFAENAGCRLQRHDPREEFVYKELTRSVKHGERVEPFPLESDSYGWEEHANALYG